MEGVWPAGSRVARCWPQEEAPRRGKNIDQDSTDRLVPNHTPPLIEHTSRRRHSINAVRRGISNRAGRISAFYHAWELLTEDSFVLNTVKGYRLVFERPPSQLAPLPPPRFDRGFSEEEVAAANRTLEDQQAISRCLPMEGQFLNTFFLVPKPGTETHSVLNCKKLNVFLEVEKFQLEYGRTALGPLSPRDFFGKLYFAQAYYSVAIHPDSRRFVRFTFQETLYEFRFLPFGLCTGPWVFTKLLKPVVQFLRRRDFRSLIYLLRRLPLLWRVPGRVRKEHSRIRRVSIPRIPDQQRQVRPDPFHNDHLLGSDIRLFSYDCRLTPRKAGGGLGSSFIFFTSTRMYDPGMGELPRTSQLLLF